MRGERSGRAPGRSRIPLRCIQATRDPAPVGVMIAETHGFTGGLSGRGEYLRTFKWTLPQRALRILGEPKADAVGEVQDRGAATHRGADAGRLA